ncbi:hypothetical protein A2W24_00095 [Microgenomates group bacterium RBG_16_45_19]|nr:MAG: hypothetical protein A2W24_00095 [Microgenomates group bacterium RBG_16_45_19]
MKASLITLYQRLFCRPALAPLFTRLHHLSLRGLGVLNAEGSLATGERWLMRHVQKHFQVRVVCDVGANEGGYTRELMTFFPKAHYHCFEPNPETFKLLQHHLKSISTIALYQQAVSDHVSRTFLYDFADQAPLKPTQPTATLASIHRQIITDFYHQPVKRYPVSTVTLDSWAKSQTVKAIDWLKIDTEGNELPVLTGAAHLLRRQAIALVQLEFNDLHAYTRTFFKDILAALPGYHFFRLLPHGWLALTDYRPLTHEIFGFQNVVALSPKAFQSLTAVTTK